MASRRWFSYMDNQNNRYALELQESDGELESFEDSVGFNPTFLPAEPPFPSRPPSGFHPRTLSIISIDGANTRRRIVVGRLALWTRLSVQGGFIFDRSRNAFWTVLRGYHEQYPLAPQFALDTGSIDGDSTGPRSDPNTI
jgi:hypothetical protein